MSLSPLLAVRLVVSDHGGAEFIGPQLGKGASTLNHELDPNYRGAKLGLTDAVMVFQITHDTRIPEAFAVACGGMFVPLPQLSDNPDTVATMAHLARVSREFAEFVGEVGERAADDDISDNDIIAIEREYGELVQAGQRLVTHLRGRNAAQKAEKEGSPCAA